MSNIFRNHETSQRQGGELATLEALQVSTFAFVCYLLYENSR